jgi:hypothetical protein
MTAFTFSWLTSPASLWFWELLEFISIIIVGVGCWGEVWAEHHKFSARPNDILPSSRINKIWERRFWLMVVGGLALELFAFAFSFLASNREISGLNLKIEELRKQNDENDRNSKFSAAMLGPRTYRLSFFPALETKPPLTNMMFSGRFESILKTSPKGNVKILYLEGDSEVWGFSQFLMVCLGDSGWSVYGNRPISQETLLKLTFSRFPEGIWMVSTNRQESIKIRYPNTEFNLQPKDVPMYKTDTPFRALSVAFMESWIPDQELNNDPSLTNGMIEIIIGKKKLTRSRPSAENLYSHGQISFQILKNKARIQTKTLPII